MTSPPNWEERLSDFIKDAVAGRQLLEPFAEANRETCIDIIGGRDLYSGKVDSDSGARMVVNMSAAHIPAFCLASRSGSSTPYKNGYDLAKLRIGTPPPGSLRQTVDAALPLAAPKEEFYFGAVELSGTGIRFYGDVCLVLKRDVIDSACVILDRNSFDLITAPLRDRIASSPNPAVARKNEASNLSGRWREDLGYMAALKVMQFLGMRERRYTTGQVAEAMRSDEDYVEVLKHHSFSSQDLQEARLAAADASHDTFASDRVMHGPKPRLESLVWRHRRRIAEEQLKRERVRVLVVTTSGRARD
jgi:hypothetical protein